MPVPERAVYESEFYSLMIELTIGETEFSTLCGTGLQRAQSSRASPVGAAPASCR